MFMCIFVDTGDAALALRFDVIAVVVRGDLLRWLFMSIFTDADDLARELIYISSRLERFTSSSYFFNVLEY